MFGFKPFTVWMMWCVFYIAQCSLAFTLVCLADLSLGIKSLIGSSFAIAIVHAAVLGFVVYTRKGQK